METLGNNSIESKILSTLREGPLRTTELIEKIKKDRITPKQSVYRELNKLKKKEIIAIGGKIVSLNQVWISKMRDFFEDAEIKYSDTKGDSILNLAEKEYINYKFNSLVSLDMFWAHAFTVFLKNMQKESSVMLYNPHEWFLIGRKASETAIIEESKKQKVHWLQIVGNKSPLDLEIKKYFDGDYAQCYFSDQNSFSDNYYTNCFGDFLIEVWLDKNIASEIDEVYETYDVADEEVIEKINSIIKKEGYSHKMKISKNKSKASKIRILFKKYFFIK